MTKPNRKHHGKTATVAATKTTKPPQYAVVILNDDFTPMDFVVQVLMRFFHMDEAQAIRVMLNVHEKGQGVCGLFNREIAETKARQVIEFAQANQYPLQARISLA